MDSNSRNESTWLEKLLEQRSLEWKNPETMATISNWKTNRLQLYIASFLAFLLIVSSVVSLFFFTPLRTLVPGYQDILRDDTYLDLEAQIGELEELIDAQEVYIQNMKMRWTENVQELSDVPDLLPDTKVNEELVERVQEDEELRTEIARRRILNKQEQKNRSLANIYFTAPVKGQISAPFMPEENHYGLDIIAPANSPILAAADGYIIFSDWTRDKGNTIGIMHEGNVITFYMHNSTLLKGIGDQVRAGEAVAIIGNSGELTDGPHVHFEIWQDGRPLDPQDYIAP